MQENLDRMFNYIIFVILKTTKYTLFCIYKLSQNYNINIFGKYYLTIVIFRRHEINIKILL
jgi:hypothetical protein